MPRPKTKEELKELSLANYKKLNDFIDSFSTTEQNKDFPKGTMNRNIRDVLGHLHHWHLMFLNWYEVGMKGESPHIPAKGYNWRTLPDLNKKIYERYKNLGLDEVREKFNTSHAEIMNLVASHSNKELFERKYYGWTRNNAMGAYIIGVLSSHYDWALKLIKKGKK
ncbi:ClbS/DfsB family four-helix bundle protein [Flagellimonas hymeniacidonis]|uniref:ClbS/DfsB family four-helix bundle protein n=1 Tax=Flagellimonas hymeniacidonis TaxID=2603628 RepID=A0A5C8V5Z8_9FLAO|nr:ClbS/DfsB family four-helix bundle protein [Flagellimonas hymeniacidonis]TXN37147.1 ClbS/DfsB family four-helix bundle protein [Flagellimonas hymeniacidonis]